MILIAVAAALTGLVVAVASALSFTSIPYWIWLLTLVAAPIAYLSRGISTMLRAVIGFLILWHLLAVLVLMAKQAGVFGEALGPYLPTQASVLLSVIFAGVVLAVSYIPVVRQVTDLADPYFETRERGTVSIPFLGTFSVPERYVGLSLLWLLLAINVAQVLITVLLNQWNGRFYTALQERDEATFWIELRFWVVIVFIWVVSAVYELYLTQYLEIRWRRWLTTTMTERWLTNGGHYRMRLTGDAADNPDQRIAEDTRLFCEKTISFLIRFFASVLSLYAFVLILWGLSANFSYQIGGINLVAIPGYLVWAALIFAVTGTVAAHYIGRPLIGVNYDRQRYEADFRYTLVRVRENDEQIALLKGEPAEREGLGRRFKNLVTNWAAYMKHTKRLTWFTSFYGQVSSVFPIIILAPAYFSGAVQLGALTQTSGAFGRVEGALALFIDLYRQLADYKSVIDRLTGFARSAETVERPPVPAITTKAEGSQLTLADLKVTLPSGQPVVSVPQLTIKAGERVLVTGPSGSGKSTLFRALSGIWPHGSGAITVPAGASLMLLPQRPYFPVGSLRDAVSYPAERGAYADNEIMAALESVKLPGLTSRLDEEQPWQMILSGGEQQRLAMARALLAKPKWLFLDEATAAIDEPGEAALYAAIRDALPDTTIISIGHRSTLANFHDRRVALTKVETGEHVAADAPLMMLSKG